MYPSLRFAGKSRSVLRVDQPREGLSLEEVLRNAPDSEKGQFRVPPVLE